MPTAVIVDAVRTAGGKRNGQLAGWSPADLAGTTIQALAERTGIDPAVVDDVVMGCVSQVGQQSANVARNAVLAAGWPESVPATTVDRQCGSSQQAVHFAAQGVMAGAYDVAVAAGIEVMSAVPMFSSMVEGMGDPYGPMVQARYAHRETCGQRGLVSQGLSAEHIAERWGLSRADLDGYGLRSQELAARARDEGRFDGEIVPVPAKRRDAAGEPIVVDGVLATEDEGIRATSLEALAGLKPAFLAGGSVTAGNSSQIADGASAVLITSEERAKELGLRPRARIVQFALAGGDPVSMLTSPIPATRKVLARAGLQLGDIDLFEINEAFASVVLAWQKELGVDMDRVNVNGGAIALGHPLGASGAKLTATLLNELERTGGRYGLQTICEGGGMANAVIVERVQ